MRNSDKRNAIALMITLFFIMAITVSIGIGLKYVKEGAQSVNSEKFMLQSRALLADFLTMLKTIPQITSINSADTLSLFLAEASYIPIHNKDVNIIIKISSARDKVNPMILNTPDKRDSFRLFLSSKGVNPEYLDILDDLMGGIKEDSSYNTNIFSENPYLFRDYIASREHLARANKFYMQTFHENSLKNIVTDELFYTSSENNTTKYKLDLNRIQPICWQMLLGCDKQRAKVLVANAGFYKNLGDIALSEDENRSLLNFSQNISYYQPFVRVEITIMQKNQRAYISFEYNLESKKGSHFVFEV
ncbi:hypothetical protein [Sulfurimonas sp.]